MLLKMNGPSSVKELSQSVGASAETLYHHIHAMLRCGLIEVDGVRPANTQKEHTYRLSNPKLDFADTNEPHYFGERAKFVSATLRKTDRDYRAAVDAASKEPELLDLLLSRRTNVRINSETMAELKRRVRELGDWLIEQDDTKNGHRVSLNIVCAPASKKPSYE